MKFTDGQWLLLPDVTAYYAAEAYSIASEGDKLVLLVPVRPIASRGDTLQGPVLTVTLSSPLPEIVRVRIEHFTGGLARGPQIPLVPQGNLAQAHRTHRPSGAAALMVVRSLALNLVHDEL